MSMGNVINQNKITTEHTLGISNSDNTIPLDWFSNLLWAVARANLRAGCGMKPELISWNYMVVYVGCESAGEMAYKATLYTDDFVICNYDCNIAPEFA